MCNTEEHVPQPTTCHDCGAKEGELHDFGCDMERCPFCGGQLITCGCIYIRLGYDYQPQTWNFQTNQMEGHPTNGLPEQVYQVGVSDEESLQWQNLLDEEGRVPYIVWPCVCARCGELWPEFFMVPDTIWNKYVQIAERNKILCHDCFQEIVTLVDADSEVLTLLAEIAAAEDHAGRIRNG